MMMNTREKGYSKRNKEVYWMNNPRNPNTETNQRESVGTNLTTKLEISQYP